MSYARWSDGDVYVFGTTDNKIICQMCRFEPSLPGNPDLFGVDFSEHQLSGDFECDTEQKMLDHLEKHRSDGDTVPEHAFERLRKEAMIANLNQAPAGK